MDGNKVRPASRLRTGLLRWGVVLAAGASAALCSYCTRTPAGVPAQQLFGLRSPVASSSALRVGPPKPFSLTDFQPLLTRPELEKVARAIEAGDKARAVQELELVLAAHPPDPGSRFRYLFLLARLRKEAGDLERALTDYDEVARVTSPLSDYAARGAVQVLYARGKAKEASERLQRLPTQAVFAEERRLLTGNIALLTNNLPLAVATFREHLKAKGNPREALDVALRLGRALLDPKLPQEVAAPEAAALEALTLARRVQREGVDNAGQVAAARELETRALGLLPAAVRASRSTPSLDEELGRVRQLVETRKYEDADTAAQALSLRLAANERWNNIGCETEYLRGRALVGRRAWLPAVEAFDLVGKWCGDNLELAPKSHYSAAKAMGSAGRHMEAAQRYAELERRFPTNSLADDARLLAALSYLELGVEARFTELLNTLPDDYPDGDMVVEGLFRLALRRIDRNEWSVAVRTLQRAISLLKEDTGRGADFAGRERYFHARALIATGDSQRGKQELVDVATEFPLSYYMLLAYSRLLKLDPELAKKARETLVHRAESEPFVIAARPEFKEPAFVRAMELLGVGELDAATRELDELGFVDSAAAPEVLWGVAMLYARGGSAKLSHAIARRLLGSAPARFPAGAWLEAWKLAYPEPYAAIVQREAQKSSVEPALIYAIMREESAFDPDAESAANAHGLMQLIVPTAKLLARPLGLPYDRGSLRRPEVNIVLGVQALAKYQTQFPQNPLLAIAAYNAGPGNPRRWLQQRPTSEFDVWVDSIPFLETRRYMKRVLSSRGAYAVLYQPNQAEALLQLPMNIASN